MARLCTIYKTQWTDNVNYILWIVFFITCRTIERERLKGGHKGQLNNEKKTKDVNSTRHKPDVLTRGATNLEYIKEDIKSKRSVNDGSSDDFVRDETNGKRHNTKRIVSRARSYANGENNTNDNSGTNSTL